MEKQLSYQVWCIWQAESTGKSQMAVEKMVEGRLRKYYEEVALMEQKFIVNDSINIKVWLYLFRLLLLVVECKSHEFFKMYMILLHRHWWIICPRRWVLLWRLPIFWELRLGKESRGKYNSGSLYMFTLAVNEKYLCSFCFLKTWSIWWTGCSICLKVWTWWLALSFGSLGWHTHHSPRGF